MQGRHKLWESFILYGKWRWVAKKAACGSYHDIMNARLFNDNLAQTDSRNNLANLWPVEVWRRHIDLRAGRLAGSSYEETSNNMQTLLKLTRNVQCFLLMAKVPRITHKCRISSSISRSTEGTPTPPQASGDTGGGQSLPVLEDYLPARISPRLARNNSDQRGQ